MALMEVTHRWDKRGTQLSPELSPKFGNATDNFHLNSVSVEEGPTSFEASNLGNQGFKIFIAPNRIELLGVNN